MYCEENVSTIENELVTKYNVIPFQMEIVLRLQIKPLISQIFNQNKYQKVNIFSNNRSFYSFRSKQVTEADTDFKTLLVQNFLIKSRF